MSEPDLAEARRSFEQPWNRLNLLRTFVCMGVAVLLIVVVLLR